MLAADLVPRAFTGTLAGRVGFHHDGFAGESGLDLVDRHPHRFGDAGGVDQRVATAHLEQHGGAIFGQFDDRWQLLQPPASHPATKEFAPHPDLLESGLDLVKRQQAAVG